MELPERPRPAPSGAALSLALIAAVTLAMLPLRSHLSLATTALVLVVPVVVGVASGGFAAGVVATLVGFVVYDLVFIPPYYTLSVGVAQNWVALVVYAVVMLVVARVVARFRHARSTALARAAELRRLFDLSELLVRESAVPELLETIVAAIVQAFELKGAAVLLPAEGHGRLRLMASAGAPIAPSELDRLLASSPGPVSIAPSVLDRGAVQVVALAASGRGIGLLVLHGLRADKRQLELLRAFANHVALALERGQLSEQALRAQLLEEVDRLRRSLVGAVSHDLRTPLATIKVSASTLLDPAAQLSEEDTRELLGLVDAQADRLDRLVANLLDMTRIQSGTLELQPVEADLRLLVADAVSALGSSAERSRLRIEIADDLPPVEVDQVLVTQVLANLIDNALRHTPEHSPVTVSAVHHGGAELEVAVSDEGAGLPAEEQLAVLQTTSSRHAGGRGGLGLGIAAAFLEAHGERLAASPGPGGVGSRFSFALPARPPAGVAAASATPPRALAARTGAGPGAP